jgi:acyl carrier protein
MKELANHSLELKDQIKRLLVERLKLEIEPQSIGDDQPLFEDQGLGLDSIDALELVLGVEQELGVRIEDEEMGSQALVSVHSLAEFVLEKRQAAAS